MVFSNMEYQFTFFDAKLGSVRSVTGLVTNVYEDQIKIKYISNGNNVDCSTCCNMECKNKKTQSNTVQSPMPTCNCIFNPPDVTTYDGPQVFFVPVANIIDISYKVNNTNRPEEKPKGDVKVMLLGISATMVKAIVVRLEFFDDNIEDAVKYVDIETGGIYDLVYENKNGTIYESRVKIVRIEEVPEGQPCKPGKGYVRENIGAHDAIYIPCYNKKDEFMQAPPVRKVRLIVDTSELFTGRYETIMLDCIRDCTMIQCANGSDMIPEISCCDDCKFKTEWCKPDKCSHFIPKPPKHNCHCEGVVTYTYSYDNRFKATVTGENVTIMAKGEKTDISIDTLLKFYLGVD